MASQFASVVKELSVLVDDFVHDELVHVTLHILDVFVGERFRSAFDPLRMQ